MSIIKVPESYSETYIETNKCRPFVDKLQEQLILEVGNTPYYPLDDSFTVAQVNKTDDIFDSFKGLFTDYITSSKLNSITGLDKSLRNDVIIGCTQYIDDLHIRYPDIQVLEHEYNYHIRLKPNLVPSTVDTLRPNIPLIISIPFSYYGGMHPAMSTILDRCTELNIPVHLDGAWITASKNIHIDFMHPAVVSLGISLSKGLGLSGWNRIGVRYTKDVTEDSISVMNDHLQIPSVPVLVGSYFIKNVSIDYLWNKHGENHYKICRDFQVNPTDTIHMATKDNKILGICNLLRYLEYHPDND